MRLYLSTQLQYQGDPQVLVIETEQNEVLEPSLLESISGVIPEVDPTRGVVINGRGPIWLYGALIHELHPVAWVATHDPRLGAIVVMSHTPGIVKGQAFPLIQAS